MANCHISQEENKPEIGGLQNDIRNNIFGMGNSFYICYVYVCIIPQGKTGGGKMSISGILTAVFVAGAGAVVLYKKWPTIERSLLIKQRLKEIEDQAYYTEAIKVAEKKGIQRARGGLLPEALTSPEIKQKVKVPKLNIKLTDGKTEIKTTKEPEFQTMKKLMGMEENKK